MRNSISRLMGVSLLSLLLIAGTGLKARAQDVEVSFQAFYDNLAPYGQWVNDPQYGDVWVPNEEGNFRPYGSRGHWVMTEYGNTWVSDDPWGWACYHYGRWTYDPYYGWVWIPGYDWAPAWVSWRYGGGTCGWAPLGPGVSAGVAYNCPDSWWVFVQPQYMYQPDCFHYWRGPQYNSGYIRQTTYVNNSFVDNHTHVQYNYGPRREAIERDTHHPVQVYALTQSNRPGAASLSGQRVSMYRPEVNRNSIREARPSSVVQAPRPLGAPHAATNISANRPPAFRQDMQQRPAQPGNRQPAQQQPRNTQPPVTREPQQQQPRNTQPPVNREPQQQQQHTAQPPVNREPQRNFQAPNRPQVQEPQRQQPQPQQRPQTQPQQRPQPMQQQRPQQMPQQQRPQPMQQQQRPEPMQQQRPQQMPQQRQEAPREAPHQEGGRR